METTKHPLDSLLKEQLENFKPEVPVNLYPIIKSKLSVPQPAGVVSKGAFVVKNLGFGIKAIILVSLTVPALAVYYMLQNKQEAPIQAIVSTPSNMGVVETEKLPESTPSLPPKKLISSVEKPKSITKCRPTEPVQTPQFQTESGNNIEPILEQKIVQPVFKNQETADKEFAVAEPVETKNNWNGTEQITENRSIEPLVIPNAFSPNSDGINDEFEINLANTLFFRLRVYHPNGTLLFETDKPSNHWKGTQQESGMPVENGSYRYILEYQFKEQPKPSMAAGYIYLNR